MYSKEQLRAACEEYWRRYRANPDKFVGPAETDKMTPEQLGEQQAAYLVSIMEGK